METRCAATFEIDDLDLAVQELIGQIMVGPALRKHSIGLLLCDSDMDIKSLAKRLHKALPFDFIGASAIASVGGAEGFNQMAISLTVFTADDCEFSAAVSQSVIENGVDQEVSAVYGSLTAPLSQAPKLILAIPPYTFERMLDEYTNAFNVVAPGVPVVGGLPSFRRNGDQNVTIFNDQVYNDRLVSLAISGNIAPVFTIKNVLASPLERKRRVTQAHGTVISRVGNQTFTDYLKEIGLSLDALTGPNSIALFASYPLLVESNPDDENGAFSYARNLHSIDPASGTGTAIGLVPEGSVVSICTLDRDDILTAAGQGMRELKEKIAASQANGHSYNTVLMFSCIGRYLLQQPTVDAEARGVLAELPAGFCLSGFYGYGEIGPQGKNQDETRAHNESLVLCAL